MLLRIPDAGIDHGKTKAGYEIPLTCHVCKRHLPRLLNEIKAGIKALEADIITMLEK